MSDILLLGHSGYLGSYLKAHIKADILSDRKIYNNGVQYKYIINCIGKPDLEYCELNKQETDYTNRDIIDDIQYHYFNSKIISFSSYYVYDDVGLCNEESKTTKLHNYTRQKLEAEQKIKNGVVFRVGKLFGHHDISKQNKLTEHIINNDKIELDEITFNPTSLKQILLAIKYELETGKLYGIFNLANEGVVTHYDYGIFINECLKTNKKIYKVESLKRFSNYGRFTMSCEKIKKYISLIDWKYDMIEYLNEIKNDNSNNNTFASK
jgi:dTDP-4-dehydrorhamnose reductase